MPVPTCAGGFILLDFAKPGNLAVVLTRRGGQGLGEEGSLGMLWSPVSRLGKERGPCPGWSRTCSHLTSYPIVPGLGLDLSEHLGTE